MDFKKIINYNIQNNLTLIMHVVLAEVKSRRWKRTCNGARDFNKRDISKEEKNQALTSSSKSEMSHQGFRFVHAMGNNIEHTYKEPKIGVSRWGLDLCMPWEMVVGSDSGSQQGVVEEGART
jgi:hypothetical protein